jgi:hypothetical protein
MAVTAESFLTIFDEFTSEPAERLAFYLQQAEASIDINFAPAHRDRAVMLWLAHQLERQRQQEMETDSRAEAIEKGSFQPIASTTLANDASHFNATVYGQQWLSLIRAHGKRELWGFSI